MDLEKNERDREVGLYLFDAIRSLSREWRGGTLHRMRTTNPALYEELRRREHEVNSIWRAWREKKASLKELKEAINGWVNLLQEFLDIEEADEGE